MLRNLNWLVFTAERTPLSLMLESLCHGAKGRVHRLMSLRVAWLLAAPRPGSLSHGPETVACHCRLVPKLRVAASR